jgi:hypothetical protein
MPTKNKDSAFDFGLDALTSAFDTQAGFTNKRQELEQDQTAREQQARMDKAKLAKASTDVTTSLLNDMNSLLGVVDSNEKAAAEQADLFTSGNPIDMLGAIGNQIADPNKYTRAGRQKVLNEAQQNVNVKSAVAQQQLTVFSALNGQIDAGLQAAAGPLEMAKLDETQGLQRIELERSRIAMQSEKMGQSIQQQQLTLSTMSAEQVAAATAKANGGPIDIGGVQISPGLLQQRSDELANRQDLMDSRNDAIELKKMERAHKLNRKVLETYNPAELRQMALNGDPTGQFDLKDINEVLTMKTSAQNDAIKRATDQLTQVDVMGQTVIPAANQADAMAKVAPAGTPLAAQVASQKTTAAISANLMSPYTQNGEPVPLELAAPSAAALKTQQEETEKAIQTQAKQQGKGDKDLTELYVERYRGNVALPTATIESAVQSRVEKNQPLTDILPKEAADSIQKIYAAKLQKINSQQFGANLTGGTLDKKDAKAQAMREAIQEGIASTLAPRTNDLIGAQADEPTSPLGRHGISRGQIIDLTAKADASGEVKFMQLNQLNSDEMNELKTTGAVKAKPGVTMADLAVVQTQELLFNLDSMSAGLSKEYVAWWKQSGQDYINSQTTRAAETAQMKGLQDQALESYAGPIQAQDSFAYKNVIEAAGAAYDNEKATRYQNLISFNQDPVNRQASLLQFDDSLSDEDRKTFMNKFILPIVDMANAESVPKSGQSNFNQINTMIEQAIDMGVAADPETQKVLNKVAKNRSKISRNLDSITSVPWYAAYMPMGLSGSPMMYTQNQMNSTSRDFAWMQSILAERGKKK